MVARNRFHVYMTGMSDKKNTIFPRLNSQDKADRTSQAASDIMSAERKASDAKVARLKALRLASQPDDPQAQPIMTTPAPRKARAAALRTLALQGDIAPKRRK